MNTQPEWLSIARRELGVREYPGDKHNPRIIQYHAATALKADQDEIPWCASFANWALQQAGLAGTHSAAARSFIDWGEKLDEPRLGCIVVFSSARGPLAGHVGFYLGRAGGIVRVIGGNQSNAVTEAEYPEWRVIGYRWPKGAAK